MNSSPLAVLYVDQLLAPAAPSIPFAIASNTPATGKAPRTRAENHTASALRRPSMTETGTKSRNPDQHRRIRRLSKYVRLKLYGIRGELLLDRPPPFVRESEWSCAGRHAELSLKYRRCEVNTTADRPSTLRDVRWKSGFRVPSIERKGATLRGTPWHLSCLRG